jgi:hypothetical protein
VYRLAEVQVLVLVWVLSLYAGGLRLTETVNRLFSGAVLREHYQAFAVEIQVYQREAGAQSVVVFRQLGMDELYVKLLGLGEGLLTGILGDRIVGTG